MGGRLVSRGQPDTTWSSSETVLGSGTFCCSATMLVPGHNSPQITLKITSCMCNLGKFWTKKIQRDQKIQLPLLRCLKQKAKAGYCPCSLCSPPPKEGAKSLSHPSNPIPGHTSTLTPYKEQACAPLGSKPERGPICFHVPPAATGALVKSCLNFLSGL